MKLKKFDDTNIENPVNNEEISKIFYIEITCQSSNYSHVYRNKQSNTDIENPVKNARNLNDISQNNNLPLKNIIYLTQR